ncbi:BnaA01g24670D [Brassica napus]|uniref:BnaA01g24670D protein n=1 Tax=Brassica napus TaxID=3708 RepID=A0A078H6Q0_BRANA|nr:BnaA01g24670D [Brassica napus]
MTIRISEAIGHM